MRSSFIWETGMRRCSRGFVLIDSLVAVFLITLICTMCFSIYRSQERYLEGYERYRQASDLHYEEIFRSLNECTGCATDESD